MARDGEEEKEKMEGLGREPSLCGTSALSAKELELCFLKVCFIIRISHINSII